MEWNVYFIYCDLEPFNANRCNSHAGQSARRKICNIYKMLKGHNFFVWCYKVIYFYGVVFIASSQHCYISYVSTVVGVVPCQSQY